MFIVSTADLSDYFVRVQCYRPQTMHRCGDSLSAQLPERFLAAFFVVSKKRREMNEQEHSTKISGQGRVEVESLLYGLS